MVLPLQQSKRRPEEVVEDRDVGGDVGVVEVEGLKKLNSIIFIFASGTDRKNVVADANPMGN